MYNLVAEAVPRHELVSATCIVGRGRHRRPFAWCEHTFSSVSSSEPHVTQIGGCVLSCLVYFADLGDNVISQGIVFKTLHRHR